MNWRSLLFIVVAALFSVAGDVALKAYGDNRRLVDLVRCLLLWEICALAWVMAYRWRLPLGRPTAIGLMMVLTLNCSLGIWLHDERFTRVQWSGLGLAALSIGLLILG